MHGFTSRTRRPPGRQAHLPPLPSYPHRRSRLHYYTFVHQPSSSGPSRSTTERSVSCRGEPVLTYTTPVVTLLVRTHTPVGIKTRYHPPRVIHETPVLNGNNVYWLRGCRRVGKRPGWTLVFRSIGRTSLSDNQKGLVRITVNLIPDRTMTRPATTSTRPVRPPVFLSFLWP